MNKYIGKHERLENVRRPISGAYFHGECWYKCPKCNEAFEFYDAIYEYGFILIKNKIYQHNKCGQLINMA